MQQHLNIIAGYLTEPEMFTQVLTTLESKFSDMERTTYNVNDQLGSAKEMLHKWSIVSTDAENLLSILQDVLPKNQFAALNNEVLCEFSLESHIKVFVLFPKERNFKVTQISKGKLICV